MTKKSIFLAVLFFASFLAVKAQKIDTTKTFVWDTATHQFINSGSEQQVFTYNNACYLTKYVINFWDDVSASYQKYYRTTNSLLGNNATSQSLTQLWDDVGKKWDNYQKGIFTYTTSPTLPSSVLYQDWQTSNSSWINSRLYIYTYDANGNTTNIVTQQWNSANSSWGNLYQNKYTYNASNLMLNFLQQIWNGNTSAWDNFNQINYSYTSFNKTAQDSGQKWNASTSSWIGTYRSQYSYDANNFLTTWNYDTLNVSNNSYLPYQQYLYTNNANGDALEALTVNWNSIGWDTIMKDVNHYNACILPVDLVSFDIKNNNEKVDLFWQTSTEVNTSYFNIQRSLSKTEKDNFKTIGFVKAKNVASNYTYQDDLNNVEQQEVFYRLEIVDNDGKKTHSNIKNITPNFKQNVVSIFPNPATDYINIKGTNIVKISVKDLAGRTLTQTSFASPTSFAHLSLKSFAKGVVFLEIMDTNKTIITKKIVIQ